MRRQHQWRWRRGGWRRNVLPGNPPAPLSESEPAQTVLEREAVRLLREWRERQEDTSHSDEPLARHKQQMREAEIVTFGWDSSEEDSVVSTMRVPGGDGVRERLRGRGEV